MVKGDSLVWEDVKFNGVEWLIVCMGGGKDVLMFNDMSVEMIVEMGDGVDLIIIGNVF